MPQFVDKHVKLTGDVRETRDGYLAASLRAARTGIQLYTGDEVGRPDKKIVKIMRPESEVFKYDSLHSYGEKPVTIDHPSEGVNRNNYVDLARGHVWGDVVRDGEFVRCNILVNDGRAIDTIRSGKKQISMGYSAEIDWTPGTTKDGEQYDGFQKNIVINHLAIVDAARGGDLLRIGDALPAPITPVDVSDSTNTETTKMSKSTVLVDGINVELDDIAAQHVSRYVRKMQGSLDDLNAKLKAKEEEEEEAKRKAKVSKDSADTVLADLNKQIEDSKGKIAVLEQNVADAAAKMSGEGLAKLVADRAALVGKCRAILGDSVKATADDKSLMQAVVAKKLGDEKTKTLSDDALRSAFDVLTADTKFAGAPATVADSFGAEFLDHSTSDRFVNAREKAFADRQKRAADAYLGSEAKRTA